MTEQISLKVEYIPLPPELFEAWLAAMLFWWDLYKRGAQSPEVEDCAH